MPRGRENTISRSLVPQKDCLDALDVRLRLSIAVVVVIVVWVLVSGGRSDWLLLPAAALAAQSSVRCLRIRA